MMSRDIIFLTGSRKIGNNSNVSSVNRSFSFRPFQVRRKVLNNCLENELDFASIFILEISFEFNDRP